MLHAVIMAGGSGTRFWPRSRRARPKQLLNFGSEQTLIQETAGRVDPWVAPSRLWVVTNQVLAVETSEQLPQVEANQILIEPCGRNTAPCIGLAAVHLLHKDPDAVMLVMPADHAIRPPDQFRASVECAVALVEREPHALVLFGVTPNSPATGYGYIERGNVVPNESSAFRVKSFREKPDRQTAGQYLTSGGFYWNCGIFIWRAQTILDALQEFEPDMHARLLTVDKAIGASNYTQVLNREFPLMKAISIDFAVLEQASSVNVVEASFEWDDVGSWLALTRLLGADAHGNTIDALHCEVDTRGCIIRGSKGHLIATAGLENCIVVQTPDATLVARKDDENALRRIVERLKELGYDQFL